MNSRLHRPLTSISSRRGYITPRRAPAANTRQVTELLDKHASSPPRPLNLSALLSFGRPLTPESLLASVSYALEEIPKRLATRVRSIEALPFIVGTNPYVSNILSSYKQSFLWFATYPTPKTIEENANFAEMLEELVEIHANDIPTMAKGFQECARYLSPEEINQFLDGAIRNRISVRLIAEQHVALSRAFQSQEKACNFGVVNTITSPAQMVRMCGSFVSELCEATLGASPSIVIDGYPDSTFAYVPVHLEYILTEILKNSFRATVENHSRQSPATRAQSLPPVMVTLSPPPRVTDSACRSSNSSGSNSNVSTLSNFYSIRVRDQGGGVSSSHISKIFSYAFTTAGRSADSDSNPDAYDYGDSGDGGGPYAAQHVGGIAAIAEGVGGGGAGQGNLFGEITGKGLQTGLGTIAGLGYGLPMSRLYAKYFGGSLDLVSLEGWGSDVFLKLRCLDEAGDSAI
ncbi:alpha-ketoacid dehydrogenase kinase [Dendrothele bispora CBS 962.96]|uniref:Protein-serine/threonine kinase n=1 Tax=Dendrothele bispora (strain CBS 962.96) TaxID=1314807 RepID=A0A4S8LMJ5_DENBC|nr:alpha-ketoacid dehydrogenase kinase [Dendrothele bispora CBS 962.96]